VVLYVKWPDVGRQITAATRKTARSLVETEQELFDVTHADVGGWLATAWHLPTSLLEPILYHHKPEAAQDAPLQTAIVHVTDILVKGLACGNPGDELCRRFPVRLGTWWVWTRRVWPNASRRSRKNSRRSMTTYERASHQPTYSVAAQRPD
jgi:hypothetical protein